MTLIICSYIDKFKLNCYIIVISCTIHLITINNNISMPGRECSNNRNFRPPNLNEQFHPCADSSTITLHPFPSTPEPLLFTPVQGRRRGILIGGKEWDKYWFTNSAILYMPSVTRRCPVPPPY